MIATAASRKKLTPQSVLKAASHIMRKEGADGLSIRRLADTLGVTPMAIYRHFDSKDALMSALLDEFIRAADVLPAEPLRWDEWIQYVGQRMWQAQVSEPDWIRLLGSVQIRAGGLGVMVKSLQTLTEAGFSSEDALEAFFTLVHISIGASCLELGLRQLKPDMTFDARDTENLGRLMSLCGSLDKAMLAHNVERSLDLLIAGMRTRLPSS